MFDVGACMVGEEGVFLDHVLNWVTVQFIPLFVIFFFQKKSSQKQTSTYLTYHFTPKNHIIMTRGTEKKDDRHSHTGMDGAPKKHGAGGKGMKQFEFIPFLGFPFHYLTQ